jgi:chemotaxis family two-component system response regulator Rcp1
MIPMPVEILLVEDNPHDLRLTEEALKDSKILIHLHVAKDGEEALEFLQREGSHKAAPRPDLILLDLNLPKVDGREVLEIIKADANLRLIPVVVLTTSEAEEDIIASYRLQANCYITKPIDLGEFTKVVQAIEGFWFSIVKLPPTDLV